MVNKQTALFIISLQLLFYNSDPVTADNRKYVGSKDCLISQYCEEQNAIDALQSVFGMTVENATDYITNRTFERSCSCHNSCGFLGVCCQDKQTQIPATLSSVAQRLQEDPSSYICEPILGEDTVIINSCPEDAPKVMRQRCAQDEELPLLVTSNSSLLNYKNIYCGMCNGETFEDLMGWSWNFDCQGLPPRLLPTAINPGISLIEAAEKYKCMLNQTIKMVPPGQMEIHNSIGVYLDSLSLCSSPPIASCPAGTSSNEVQRCLNNPLSLIIHDGLVYRNEHCLQCNRGAESIDSAICDACDNDECKHPSVMIHQRPLFGSFGILVQPYDDAKLIECKTVANQQDCGEILPTLATCGHGQYLDYKTSKCKSVCPEAYYLKGGTCNFSGFNTICPTFLDIETFRDAGITKNKTNQLLQGSTFILLNELTSNSCYRCNNMKIITAETAEFTISDGEVRYMNTLISPGLVYEVDRTSFYACLDAVITTTETLPSYEGEEIVTHLLLSLSIISIILYFVAYFLFRRLRNIPGKIIAGNMLCLLFAYVLFFMRQIPGLDTSSGCKVVAILINYFFLASFIFNIVYAGFIVHSLDFINFESRVNKWTAVQMWLIALLVPLAVIAPGIMLDELTTCKYRPGYGGRFCFIGGDHGQQIYFIAPIGICLLIAIILYLVITIKLALLAKQTARVRSHHSEKIAIAIKLLIVLGFNWIFAIIAAVDQGRVTTLVFIITCTLQGFFGFIVFICNKATLNDIRKCMKKGPSSNIEMYNSSSCSSRKTKSTVMTKSLHHMDSSKSLLKPPENASV